MKHKATATAKVSAKVSEANNGGPQLHLSRDEIIKFSDRLSMARMSIRASQEELAKAAGVSAASISLWETGKGLPRRRRLTKIANALRTTEEYLLTGEGGAEGETTVEQDIQRLKLKISTVLGVALEQVQLMITVGNLGNQISPKQTSDLGPQLSNGIATEQ